MKKRALIPLLILMMAIGGAQLVTAHTPSEPTRNGLAQTGFTAPPTIISFTSELEEISLADAEEGTVTATLTWRTVGMTDDFDLVLHEYGLGSWIFVLDEELNWRTFAGGALIMAGIGFIVVRRTVKS